MYKTTMLLAATFFLSAFCFSQIPSKVDYDAFEKLVKEVKDHRAERLVSIEKSLVTSRSIRSTESTA